MRFKTPIQADKVKNQNLKNWLKIKKNKHAGYTRNVRLRAFRFKIEGTNTESTNNLDRRKMQNRFGSGMERRNIYETKKKSYLKHAPWMMRRIKWSRDGIRDCESEMVNWISWWIGVESEIVNRRWWIGFRDESEVNPKEKFCFSKVLFGNNRFFFCSDSLFFFSFLKR
jgi:hypothetical protein